MDELKDHSNLNPYIMLVISKICVISSYSHHRFRKGGIKTVHEWSSIKLLKYTTS